MTQDLSGNSTAVHLASLETRVTGLEKGMRDVAEALQDLSTKIDQRAATPWPVIWSALGVLLTFFAIVGGLAYAPISASQARIESLVVPRAEIDYRVQAEAQRREAAIGALREANVRQDEDVRRLRESIVPRVEHDERWSSQRRWEERIEEDLRRMQDRILK